MKKPFRIALVGCGFMGRAHSNAYLRVRNFFDVPVEPVLAVACARDRVKAEAFAATWGYQSVETDWRQVVARPDIDAVDICVPNNLHHDIAVAAARAGKAVLCEKPLAMNAREGEAMCAAVEQAGVANTVWYNYRRIPALSLAKQLVDEGKLGKIYHCRSSFLQDWTISSELPQGGAALWRLDAQAAGSGVTGDLLAHCIDAATWMNGAIASVQAMTEVFVKERVHTATGKLEPVTIDDACTFMCRFANGSLGVFESTRYARGHKAGFTLEINGAKASLKWDLEDLHRLQWFEHADESRVRGWRSIHVTDHDGSQPYMKQWWVPGLQIGYEHSFVHHVADFLTAYARRAPCPPTFRDALATQQVCDAVLASAGKGNEGHWETVRTSK